MSDYILQNTGAELDLAITMVKNGYKPPYGQLPRAVLSSYASSTGIGRVRLSWSPVTESENSGYKIAIKRGSLPSLEDLLTSNVSIDDPSISQRDFIDLDDGMMYGFWIATKDSNGNLQTSVYSNTKCSITTPTFIDTNMFEVNFPSEFLSSSTFYFYRTRSGRLFCSSSDSTNVGIYELNLNTMTWTQKYSLGYSWQYWYESVTGDVYVTSSAGGGILHLSGGSNFNNIYASGSGRPNIFETSTGILIVIFNNNILDIRQGIVTVTTGSRTTPDNFFETSNNELFEVYNASYPPYIYNFSTYTFSSFGSGQAAYITEDANSNVWSIGKDGFYKLNLERTAFVQKFAFTSTYTYPYDITLKLTSSSGFVFFSNSSSFGGGAWVYSPITDTVNVIQNLHNGGKYTNFYEDARGNVFFGNDARLHAPSGKLYRFDGDVSAIILLDTEGLTFNFIEGAYHTFIYAEYKANASSGISYPLCYYDEATDAVVSIPDTKLSRPVKLPSGRIFFSSNYDYGWCGLLTDAATPSVKRVTTETGGFRGDLKTFRIYESSYGIYISYSSSSSAYLGLYYLSNNSTYVVQVPGFTSGYDWARVYSSQDVDYIVSTQDSGLTAVYDKINDTMTPLSVFGGKPFGVPNISTRSVNNANKKVYTFLSSDDIVGNGYSSQVNNGMYSYMIDVSNKKVLLDV